MPVNITGHGYYHWSIFVNNANYFQTWNWSLKSDWFKWRILRLRIDEQNERGNTSKHHTLSRLSRLSPSMDRGSEAGRSTYRLNWSLHFNLSQMVLVVLDLSVFPYWFIVDHGHSSCQQFKLVHIDTKRPEKFLPTSQWLKRFKWA